MFQAIVCVTLGFKIWDRSVKKECVSVVVQCIKDPSLAILRLSNCCIVFLNVLCVIKNCEAVLECFCDEKNTVIGRVCVTMTRLVKCCSVFLN